MVASAVELSSPRPSACGGAEVEFVDDDGVAHRQLLETGWSVAFERARPVREFGSYRGQRNWPGWWWFSGTGDLVGYESWVERDALMVLDADPAVAVVASQPMRLHWTTAGGDAHCHVPDFFARRTDGTAALVDVRPGRRVRGEDAAVVDQTAGLADQVGWEYQEVGELPAVRAANLRWLAGYRYPRCAQPVVMAALREAFTVPRPLWATATTVGDPIAVLPVLFSMLRRGQLGADLVGRLLGPHSTVWPGQYSGWGS